MQPIRNYWSSPENLGYTENDTNKILEYRETTKTNIENLSSKSTSCLLAEFNQTHVAHIKAAAETDTASPSGALMYHGGEILSGVTSAILGSGVAESIFGPASEFFNNPIGDSGRENRNTLTRALIKTGDVIMKVPNKTLKASGSGLHIIGKVMSSDNFNTEQQYKIIKSQSTPKSLDKIKVLPALNRTTSYVADSRIKARPFTPEDLLQVAFPPPEDYEKRTGWY